MGFMLYSIFYYLYLISLSILTLYCFWQFKIYLYSEKKIERKGKNKLNNFPRVTVQLPVYNERYVVERLIDQVCRFNYPLNRLQVQLVDDSDDITAELIEKKVCHYKVRGYDIVQVRRKNRTGFKAGALKNAMRTATGEFIAIFDADFLPDTEFLQDTIPYFQDDKIGVVQSRWGHINEDYSLITQMQAFHLDMHFLIEQEGRHNADVFLQFNGTGGIWRKRCIDDAGGWSADTLTEDLDLSYRAQVKGWKIRYLKDIESPAELPAEMQGLKSQQFRWMKGGAENARKLLPLIADHKISWKKKIHAFIHLLSSSVYLFLLTGLLSSLILLFFYSAHLAISIPLYLFSIGFLVLGLVYYKGNKHKVGRKKQVLFQGVNPFFYNYPVFLSLSMGMTIHNSIAVLEGFFKIKTPFVRTPKYALSEKGDFRSNVYKINRIPYSTYLELTLAFLFTIGVVYGIYVHEYAFILFHLMAAMGFAYIAIYSVKHGLGR